MCGISLKDRCRYSDETERCGLKEDEFTRVEKVCSGELAIWKGWNEYLGDVSDSDPDIAPTSDLGYSLNCSRNPTFDFDPGLFLNFGLGSILLASRIQLRFRHEPRCQF
ncbi:hypothetical protein EVAR_57075_1 [Eumeta japonica]|uniref:Uncharacterized protein n=1 Tax=Eumeta variegata TaxID=151549 RepID=A0A4C1Y7Q7_EUMVA|nr:hypothetical protein EVAR_57075_1 [Eumeta japonica]